MRNALNSIYWCSLMFFFGLPEYLVPGGEMNNYLILHTLSLSETWLSYRYQSIEFDKPKCDFVN